MIFCIMSRLYIPAETPGQKALHSSNLGTAFYVSPEQNAGRQYTEKVDIYALGIIFFEMNCPFGTEMERCTVRKRKLLEVQNIIMVIFLL